MKKIPLLLLLLALSAIAQPKKYQSLLWEISGNGLAKKSYLYGSMHVSEKVSYHLSDAFFKHLLASDYVANESDPSTWIGLYDVMGSAAMYNFDYPANAFYSRFYQQPIKREDLYPLFVSNNNIMNNLLFRTTETQKDYQEDTYLDMFIYQTGKKYRKQVVGLEDAKTSMISIMNAEVAETSPKEENMQAIVKLLKERSFNQALLDYYRDKNLDMLDSLYTLATPGGYLKALIYDRNNVMAKSIDSIARKGSLFAAIGAAHLPGKNGVIEILRKKGYTVTPVIDAYTDKGRTVKKQIDEYFIKPQFELRTTADGMIKLPMHAQPIYNEDNIDTPDLANGGIVNLKRIPLRDYLKKDNIGFSAKSLDSLFYENIPGDIIEKKFYTEDNYSVYDIRNKTKTGNAQHYRYFVTPLEAICVSMSGNGSYTRQYENEIFANIKLKKYASGWETVSPVKGGFSVQIPAYYALYGNRDSSNPKNIEINAWDEKQRAWYFLTERTVDDNSILENTAFELKRIQEEFYRQFEATASFLETAKTDTTYESKSKLGENEIRLKTIVDGQKYYLLGTVRASAENTAKFFDSFQKKPFNYSAPMRTFTDSIGHFSISIPEKENEKLFWKIKPNALFARYTDEKKNLFENELKEFTFSSASGKTIDLKAWKYHRYDYIQNRDSLIVNLKKNILEEMGQFAANSAAENEEAIEVPMPSDNFSSYDTSFPFSNWNKYLLSADGPNTKSEIKLVNEKETIDAAKNSYKLEITAERADSEQAIKYNIFAQDGHIWMLKTLVEKGYKNDDAFLEGVISSFKPLPETQEQSVFSKKVKMFFEDARNENDTIRYSALQSIRSLEFDKQDLGELKSFLDTYEFRPDETYALSALLEKIGRIDDPLVIPFLESYYKKENSNTMLQLAVIQGLVKQESKTAYKKILELLEYDLPLSDNEYEISGLFSDFGFDLENSKVLFPGIFQFYGVSEYRAPIIRFTSQLFQTKQVNPKKLKSYRKMLLTDARLEYKRVAGWKAKEAAKTLDETEYYGASPIASLKNYCNLLFPFKSDKAVAELLRKTEKLAIPEMNLELARLELENGLVPNPATMQQLYDDPGTKFTAFRMMLDNKKPMTDWKEQDIALAAISGFANTDPKNATIEFLSKRILAVDGKTITVFFFKTTPKENGNNPFVRNESKIATAAFVNGKNGIDAQAWKTINAMPISDPSAIESDCDAIVDRLLNGHHQRASFGKQKPGLFPSYMEDEY